MTLFDLQENQIGIITKIKGRQAFRKRLREMGFVKGHKIKMIKKAPLNDPIEFKLMDYNVSLRRSECLLVEIITPEEAIQTKQFKPYEGIIIENFLKTSAIEKEKTIDVALIGNPNSGKTTIFNYASNSTEHTGNFAGVTIEVKKAKFKYKDYTFNLIDLPGVYSLSSYSSEELYVRKYILSNNPDVIINVIDASNIERNLYLTTQLIDMDLKVVIALNMYDELSKKGDKFDYDTLGKMLGIPFVPTIGCKSKGIKELLDKIIEVYEDKEPYVRHIHINYGEAIENGIRNIQKEIKANHNITDKISSRYYAIKLLEKDKGIKFIVSRLANHKQIIEVAEKEIKKLEKEFLEDSETLIIDAKYGFISGALKETYVYNRHPRQRTETEVIDTFLTHKLFGIPIFIFFMWLMFQTTFSIGAYPTLWIEKLINYLQLYLNQIMNEGILKDLLINGIISGVGGVIKFLPNILILFFFIALMEQTGYMARATFIMDRIMHRIGLHGKSFIPLIMGFGCNVPAIMSTRTIESKNDRLLTILINPLMSCTARLPLYLLIAGAFFPNIAGHIVFFMYVIGILLAFVVAIIFKKTFFKGEETPFVMELPPYRMPIMRSLLKYMWHKASQYLNKIGSVILIASIIIWALGYFPKNYHIENESKIKISELIHKSQKEITNTKKLQNIENIIINTKQKIIQIEKKSKADKLSESYIGKLGKFIEPIMKPLGFDWKMSVSIIAGIPAKEIIVSTMNILYQLNDETYNYSLPKQLKLEKNQQGQFVYSKLVAFSYMLFVLIYFPCIATIITISKETGSWKWGIFTIIYTTLLAWIISFTVYQISTVIT